MISIIKTNSSKQTAIVFLFAFTASVFLLNSAQANEPNTPSPEARCFDLLNAAAKTHPIFKDVELGQLQKTNQTQQGRPLQSEPFSAHTYDDFMTHWNVAVPQIPQDIQYYPKDLKLVSSQYKYPAAVHKANKTLSSQILYYDDSKAPETNNSAAPNGYFVDSRFLTFGNKSDFGLFTPQQVYNTESNKNHHTAPPITDPRQYVVFTQHLSPEKGGHFLGCNISKISPQPGFLLAKNKKTEISISDDQYGTIRPRESSVVTKTLADENFLQSNIQLTINQLHNPNTRLLRNYTINISYNNKSSFLNDFEAMPQLSQVLPISGSLSNNELEFKTAYYQNLTQTNLAIAAPHNHKGLALLPNIPVSLFNKIKKLEDYYLSTQLQNVIWPFDRPYDESVHALFSWEKITQNIQHILNPAINGASPDSANLKLKDLSFASVLNISDARVDKIQKSDLKTNPRHPLNQYFTQTKFEDLTAINALHEEFKQAQIQAVHLKAQQEGGEISNEEHLENLGQLVKKFESFANTLAPDLQLTEADVKAIATAIYQPPVVKKTQPNNNLPVSKTTDSKKIQTSTIVISGVLLLLFSALAAGWWWQKKRRHF